MQNGSTATAFILGDGPNPITNTLPNKLLKRTLARAGLPSVTFHGLRHSFVAAHIAAGTPVKAIQEMAGHASITTTMDRYGHLLPQSNEQAARAIQDAVFGSAEPE
jgi:integrase